MISRQSGARQIPRFRCVHATVAAPLAGLMVLAVLGDAGERLAWAQNVPAGFPGCQPGIHAADPEGDAGALSLEIQICGHRGRVSTSMGGGTRGQEFEPTPDYFAPSIIAAGFPWTPFWGPKLCEVPSGSDLPGATVTARLFSYVSTTDVSTTITLSPDKDKPKLTTTSQPPKGSKVTPGEIIQVTMRASEKYEDAGSGWQTGVRKILLRDESASVDVSPHYENSGPPRPCDRKQWEQSLTVDYKVPPDAPPVVRLRAIAEDFAGNRDEDVAEFPLRADWSGKLTWLMHTQTPGGSWTKLFGSADLAVNRNGPDKLTGTIQGDVKMEGEDRETGLCPSFRTATPTIGKARLVGSYSPAATVMSLATADVVSIAQGQTTPCAGTALPIVSADFAVMLHTAQLQQQPDKSFHAGARTESTQGGSTVINSFSLSLRPNSD